MRGNAHTRPLVFTIGKQAYQLNTGQGGKDALDALNYSVGPGTSTVVIKIPGEAVDREAETRRGRHLGDYRVADRGYLPMRMC